MTDGLDVDAMVQRLRERAHAVKIRPRPPVAGEERTTFVKQAQAGFREYAVGDADATIEAGGLSPRIDRRPPGARD